MGDFEQPFVMAFAFAFGAVVGSFLNVIIYRLPREISIVRTPPSSCPACSTPIRWYDNIPLISWVFLRGRCRECEAPISLRYPLVELVSGLLAVAAVARWGLSVAGFEVVIFAWVSVTLGLIDLDFQILPDVLTYPSIVFGLVCSFVGGYTWWLDSLAGVAVGALLPILVIVVYKLLRGITTCPARTC
ncbi:MAG: prepilin peptidase [Acidobacteriota bacterium]